MKKSNKKNICKYKSKSSDKKSWKLFTYFILRLFVLISLIVQIYNKNWNNVFLCLLTFVLFMLPSFIDKKLNISLPSALEIIIILFIFSAEILGEIRNFYGTFKHWDTILHTINGFLCAAIGFSLIDILNQTPKFHIKLSPIFVALVAFCFSMTIGILWEFFEFEMDYVLKTDMQKDRIVSTVSSVELNKSNKNIPILLNDIKKTQIYYTDKSDSQIKVQTIEGGYLDIGIIDTMKDLFVNFIGALVFSIIGLLYIKDRDEYKFAEQFIPTIKEKIKDENK